MPEKGTHSVPYLAESYRRGAAPGGGSIVRFGETVRAQIAGAMQHSDNLDAIG